jgi:hypothetical protein
MTNLKEINIFDTGQSSTITTWPMVQKASQNIINGLDVLMRTLNEDLVRPEESS